MGSKRNFDFLEAVVLLNIYLVSKYNDIAPSKAIVEASRLLRLLAVKRGYNIDNKYRSVSGIYNRFHTIAKMYEEIGSIGYSGTHMFDKVIDLYRNDREIFDQFLDEANTIIPGESEWLTRIPDIEEKQKMAHEKFWKWLSMKVTTDIYDDMFGNYRTISAILQQKKVLMKPMLSVDDPEQIRSTSEKVKNIFSNPKTRQCASRLLQYYLGFLETIQVSESEDTSNYVANDKRLDRVNSDNTSVASEYESSNVPSKIHSMQNDFQQILSILRERYANGIRFEETALRVLEEQLDIVITDDIQKKLKKVMFRRNDELFFFPEIIDNQQVVLNKEKIAENIYKFGCIDIETIWKKYSEEKLSNCLRDKADLEDYLKFLIPNDIRVVSVYNTQIIKGIGTTKYKALQKAAELIIQTITEAGCITLEDLSTDYPVFTKSFIRKLLIEYTDEVIPCVINDYLCYQTIESMGFDSDFSRIVDETIDCIDELNLSPSQEIIHALLCVKLGINFRDEYNIPDDKTFRRIISVYCSESNRKVWKAGCFVEVNKQNV